MEFPIVPIQYYGVRRRKLDGAGILTAVFPPHSSATALHRPGAKATHSPRQQPAGRARRRFPAASSPKKRHSVHDTWIYGPFTHRKRQVYSYTIYSSVSAPGERVNFQVLKLFNLAIRCKLWSHSKRPVIPAWEQTSSERLCGVCSRSRALLALRGSRARSVLPIARNPSLAGQYH